MESVYLENHPNEINLKEVLGASRYLLKLYSNPTISSELFDVPHNDLAISLSRAKNKTVR